MGLRLDPTMGDPAAEHSTGIDYKPVAIGMPSPQTQTLTAKARTAGRPWTPGAGLVDGLQCEIDLRSPINGVVSDQTIGGGLPGSADGLLSSVTLLLTTGLLGVLLFASDLAQRALWRRRLWVTIALSGVSICIFGILQKIGGPPVLSWVWEESKQDMNNNFGMFRYRGNAGAFLNLCLPLVAGLAFMAFQEQRIRGGAGFGWGACCWWQSGFN